MKQNAVAPVLRSETLGAVRAAVLQRKCACGQHAGGGECEECKKKNEGSAAGYGSLQRKASSAESTPAVPPIVHEVLCSPGQPLDATTREFFEPRFGYDFSRVRVHTDARAAESARAVDALAYTAGNDIAFAAGQFAPETAQGRSVLAHELTHVLQARNTNAAREFSGVSGASDTSEIEADATARFFERGTLAPGATRLPGRVQETAHPEKLSRLVDAKALTCKAGVDGAPADPLATLTEADQHAQALAGATSVLLTLAAGFPDIDDGVTRAYKGIFGSPPKVAGGFQDRFHGTVKKTFNEAFAGELEGRAGRFERLTKAFDQSIRYRCINGPVNQDGCSTDCNHADASACENVSSIFICPTFWGVQQPSKATLLIHEATHMVFGLPEKDAPGGPKSSRAECYASLVSDLFNLPRGGPPCPPP